MTEEAGGVVSDVAPGSLADEAGIAPGDAVISIDDRALRDAVDFQFYAAEPEITVRLRKANGRDDLIVFEKDPDEDLGIAFERPTWDGVTVCNNKCFFCFLKGLPKGMRKPLYLKDDDYRLSFMHGNFVTLTNLTEDDWARLEEQRLSPLHVSAHATERELRRTLLGNHRAPDVMAQLRRLGEIGIRAHTQIVLTPGVNDGAALDRSLADLVGLYPTVQSVAVVPVGASPRLEQWSAERDGIALEAPTPAYARALLRQLGGVQRNCRARHGATIVHAADEYLLIAGARIPAAHRYDGFAQYENGIGMVRALLDDWRRTKRRLRQRPGAQPAHRRVVAACGTLIAPVLSGIADELSAMTGATIEVRPVENRVFGSRVNVSGLLCGSDHEQALAGVRADVAVLPRTSLDYFGERFLDGVTPAELAASLGMPVAFATMPSELADIVAGGAGASVAPVSPNGAMWSDDGVPLPAQGTWQSA